MSRYAGVYDLYIKKPFGKRRIKDLKPIFIEEALMDMADRGYATKTIRDVYNILNAMMKYAMHNRMITYNPCQRVELPKTKKKEIRVLTMEEQKEILKYAKGRQYEYWIIVALGTGMRAGEISGLTWDDIDFTCREIRINKTLVHIRDLETKQYKIAFQTPKTASGTRVVPMQDSVYFALKRQKIKMLEESLSIKEWAPKAGFENLVFMTAYGTPITKHSISFCLQWIEKQINKEREKTAEKLEIPYEPIPHFYPHAFRHTFATRCFEAGMDAKVVQNYLGHSTIAITLDLYTHVSDDKAHSEMEKLQQLYQTFTS